MGGGDPRCTDLGSGGKVEGGEAGDEVLGFEGDGDDLAEEAEDVLGVAFAVGVVDYAGAGVGGDAVRVDDPFGGGARGGGVGGVLREDGRALSKSRLIVTTRKVRLSSRRTHLGLFCLAGDKQVGSNQESIHHGCEVDAHRSECSAGTRP